METAGVAGQTALSGSQFKPPALPEVHDWTDPLFPLSTNLDSFLSSVKSLYGGSGGLLHARQRAESVRLYSKNWVELAAKVFESDDRS